MAARRAFIAGLLAAGVMPHVGWAALGNPAYLSAALRADGVYVLCGLDADGKIIFERPLPARGHAAAAHPHRAEAVAFARRPGTFAVVLDCVTGLERTPLSAPKNRHFYGHGAFSADGKWLFTTENDFEAGRGRIGVWDAAQNYQRVGEFGSGGIGPHDIKLMPDGVTLVVANGGIETHPDTGRAKLNLSSMRSNLCYMDVRGNILSRAELPAAHQRNSIRHIAVSGQGTVAFAMQWQGDLGADVPLLGVHRRGQMSVQFAAASTVRHMQGYLGSVAMSADGRMIATTSPRSGHVLVVDVSELRSRQNVAMPDVCGVVPTGQGFLMTTGNGLVQFLHGRHHQHALKWDNHLIMI